MKALVYDGPQQASVNDVPDARIEGPADVLVQIPATRACG
jgi:glutathione-independent formaldehyde dehydrogenase